MCAQTTLTGSIYVATQHLPKKHKDVKRQLWKILKVAFRNKYY